MIIDAKKKLRLDLQKKRRLFIQKNKKTPFFHDIGPFFNNFIQNTLNVPSGSIIAGYWPLKDEADCRPLLTFLSQRGFFCALPYVEAKDAPLSFRSWSLEDTLTSCPYFTGLLQPFESRPLLTPKVLLIPFLGFDEQGHRLGYGGGFYDRTLRHLRHAQKELPSAIGVGFSMQKVDLLPTTPEDEPLNWILTEQGLQQAV